MGLNWLPVFRALADAFARECAALNALDQALGDGDHGTALSTAFREYVASAQADAPLAAHLKQAGLMLMNRVGGSSGALYGTLFLRLSAVLQDVPVPDAPALALAFAQGTESVMQRGKAQPGDKTMVDALVPAVAALQAHASGSTPEAALHHAAQAARQGAEATRTLIARQGRARFTGERSLGHVDAGAVSVALLFETLALAWKDVDDAKA